MLGALKEADSVLAFAALSVVAPCVPCMPLPDAAPRPADDKRLGAVRSPMHGEREWVRCV
jgi:hypothetical protein